MRVPQVCEIWPETDAPLGCFCRLTTQINVSPKGQALGLRYESILVVFRLLGVPRAEWPDLFDALRIMESEAVKIWNDDGR